jgi:hypothetical protein
MRNSLVEIVTLALSLAGIVWKISQVQSEIYSFIITEINRIEKTLDIHINSQLEKEEMAEYLINDCRQAIEHKARRLEENVKDLKLSLEKKGVL